MKTRECVVFFEKKMEETGSDLWYFDLETMGKDNLRTFMVFALISSMYDLVKMRRDRWEAITTSLEALVGEEEFNVEAD